MRIYWCETSKQIFKINIWHNIHNWSGWDRGKEREFSNQHCMKIKEYAWKVIEERKHNKIIKEQLLVVWRSKIDNQIRLNIMLRRMLLLKIQSSYKAFLFYSNFICIYEWRRVDITKDDFLNGRYTFLKLGRMLNFLWKDTKICCQIWELN